VRLKSGQSRKAKWVTPIRREARIRATVTMPARRDDLCASRGSVGDGVKRGNLLVTATPRKVGGKDLHGNVKARWMTVTLAREDRIRLIDRLDIYFLAPATPGPFHGDAHGRG